MLGLPMPLTTSRWRRSAQASVPFVAVQSVRSLPFSAAALNPALLVSVVSPFALLLPLGGQPWCPGPTGGLDAGLH
jgi:hypothetical protein